jgi:hypothetical protein
MRKLFLAMVVLGALAVPSSALAAPTGEFAKFAKCPLSNATIDACFYSASTGGEVKTGAKTVPIVNSQVLQGGLDYLDESFTGRLGFLGASDGNTLVKTPQPVPGGLTGVTAPSWWPSILRDLFNETINNGFTGVTATVELAAPASAIKLSTISALTQTGTALEMPVKIKLGNPFLGSNCYIGSNSNPIVWKFTTGTTSPPAPNTPITGSPGGLTANENTTIVRNTGVKLVDNSFATPGASGCGGILFSWAVDPLVNSIVGVPSPAGTNTAILINNIEFADPAAVKASE